MIWVNYTLCGEPMPIGNTGRQAMAHFMDIGQVKQNLEQPFDLVPGVMPGGGPARYVQVKGSDLFIGFITPISQHFCETCNRVRLSVDGALHLCLRQDHRYPLRPLLRQGVSDTSLKDAILAALKQKPLQHNFLDSSTQPVRFMSITGG